ncbi:probable eukaryotic translation initiation factor 5-2 [Phtheirospermum japonicum]|uniref:Probable eukaryotic translation initiation factor 5-2 n=1 Tax=Phtheirospermum japonicum TaxID=374723 RepID=A0A830BNH1_9LAMI|nr:probable eukaryotic translation initiation factor 5-2 [Phtheirospermum japonicum]
MVVADSDSSTGSIGWCDYPDSSTVEKTATVGDGKMAASRDSDLFGLCVSWSSDHLQTAEQQLNAITTNMVMLSADEEEKPTSVKPKFNGESNRVKPESEIVDLIKEFVKKGSPASKLKPFLESLIGPRQEIVDVFFEALFEGVGKGLSKEAVKKKKYIADVVEEEGSQPLLLHAIETFCGKASPEAAKEVALVLKALYDDDVLEEEFIVEWYEKGLSGGNKSSLIWKNVKPFVEWL